MRNIKEIFWLISVTGLLLVSSACKNVQTKNKDKNKILIESTSDSSEVLMDKESVLFLLPSPGEILEGFYSADIKYNPEVLNPTDNKDKYIGSKAQSLNLGVYITDMAYSAMFERSAETVRYLEVIQTLSNEVGVSSNIFESLLSRSKANTGKIDSLVNISNEAFRDMLEFLETGGKENIMAHVSAGAYIESLFIAMQSVNEFSENNKILGLVADMKYPMDNLLEQTKRADVNETDNNLLNYLNQISLIFNELDTNSSEIVISQPQKGVVSVTGGDKLTMNEMDFNKLKGRITEIRTNIVSF